MPGLISGRLVLSLESKILSMFRHYESGDKSQPISSAVDQITGLLHLLRIITLIRFLNSHQIIAHLEVAMSLKQNFHFDKLDSKGN